MLFMGYCCCNCQGQMELSPKLKKRSLTVLELQRVLIEIQEQRPDICIRYRLIGEMWKTNFIKIISVVEKGIFLKDEQAYQLIHLQNIENIMQFEIDHNFQNFEAHFHYDITLDVE
jgi:hypothetical protein